MFRAPKCRIRVVGFGFSNALTWGEMFVLELRWLVPFM